MKYKIMIALLIITAFEIIQVENKEIKKEPKQKPISYKSLNYKRPEKIFPPIQKKEIKETEIVIPVTHDLFKDAPNEN